MSGNRKYATSQYKPGALPDLELLAKIKVVLPKLFPQFEHFQSLFCAPSFRCLERLFCHGLCEVDCLKLFVVQLAKVRLKDIFGRVVRENRFVSLPPKSPSDDSEQKTSTRYWSAPSQRSGASATSIFLI